MITLKHLYLTDLLPTWECEELQNARLKNTVLSATWEPRCRAFFLEEQDVSIANSIFSYLFLKQSPIKCGEEVGNPFLSPTSIWEMKGLPRAWYVESIGTLITLAFTSDTVVLCQAKHPEGLRLLPTLTIAQANHKHAIHKETWYCPHSHLQSPDPDIFPGVGKETQTTQHIIPNLFPKELMSFATESKV